MKQINTVKTLLTDKQEGAPRSGAHSLRAWLTKVKIHLRDPELRMPLKGLPSSHLQSPKCNTGHWSACFECVCLRACVQNAIIEACIRYCVHQAGKTKFLWRPQDTGEARTVGLLLRKATCMVRYWLKRAAMSATAHCRTGGVQRPKAAGAQLVLVQAPGSSYRAAGFGLPAWASVFLWSAPSLLFLPSGLLEW